ncbi:MAG TPA: hypothetical protein DDX92_04170 [Flavobacteriales bacterium]|nr:hypothetical protein [Flavobacteriales bacterium]
MQLENATSAYVMILNQTATFSNNYILDVQQTSTWLDLSSYPAGAYTLILICDGMAVDAKNLIIN